MNIVVLDGRLGDEPNLEQKQDGGYKISFSLWSKRPFKNRDGEYDSDCILCSATKKNAEFIGKYFHKGDGIQIRGRIVSFTYNDRDGIQRVGLMVVVEEAQFPLSMPSRRMQEDE